MRKGIYLLPNLLTTAALFAGFFAVVAAMDGNFQKAAVAIFVAMVMDGLDGRVARLTSTESDFGKEYDSLADMVSFGLAPALVIYEWGVVNLSQFHWLWGRLGWLAAFFYSVCAALRLARYNARIGLADKRFFEGLPSPSGAALVAGLVGLASKYEFGGGSAFVIAFMVTATAGALMVSNFPYYSGKDFNLGGRIPFAYLLLVPAVFMVISLDPPLVLFSLFALYALSGPILSLIRWVRRRDRDADNQPRKAA
ncbi:MAG: CDP-diacylglycerol--serine O-phosphatidyltransferase [Chromatiales bacterium]|nr:CDP-diacylglycerol--serine O-phosphatidyltransferase [Chromatiales bacterium]